MSSEVFDLPDVSRETFERLKTLKTLVEKWTRKINLISRNDIPEIWTRHIVDSAQLYGLAPLGSWLDIGSGGGFPGLVVAILAQGRGDDRPITLMDSDQRKCVFLRAAARDLNLKVTVSNSRVESADPACADVISARALADLATLLEYADRHLAPDGQALFMKGKSWRAEDHQAQRLWSYDLDSIKSNTDPEAIVLRIKEIRRV